MKDCNLRSVCLKRFPKKKTLYPALSTSIHTHRPDHHHPPLLPQYPSLPFATQQPFPRNLRPEDHHYTLLTHITKTHYITQRPLPKSHLKPRPSTCSLHLHNDTSNLSLKNDYRSLLPSFIPRALFPCAFHDGRKSSACIKHHT